MEDIPADLGWVHDDGGDEVEEDVVAVGPDRGVVERHLQLVHGLEEQPLGLVVEVLERRLLRRRDNTHTHTHAHTHTHTHTHTRSIHREVMFKKVQCVGFSGVRR